MNILGTLLSIGLTLCLVFFATMNLETVTMKWSPVHDPVQAPLYLICFTTMALGFLFGSILSWAYGSKTRVQKREQQKQIKKLEKRLAKIGDTAANDATEKTGFLSKLPAVKK